MKIIIKNNAKYNSYRYKWENNPRMGIVERVPIHLDLELTTKCNFKCPFCPRTLNTVPIMDMPLKTVKRIIDESSKKGGSSIKFVYLGEPLMYKFLPSVIKYAKKQGIVETIIATNGSLLSDELGIQLIKNGLDWIILSIDSCKIDVYEKLRKNGDFIALKINVARFYNNRFKMRSKTPKIWIQCIKQPENLSEIESGEFQKCWSPYCDKINFSELEEYNVKETIPETPNFFCENPYRRLTIRANGDIALCCGQRLDSKILGNIKNNTIEEIWTSVRYNDIRRLMKSGNSHLIEPCKTCSYRLLKGDSK